jgi:hypothetical protein
MLPFQYEIFFQAFLSHVECTWRLCTLEGTSEIKVIVQGLQIAWVKTMFRHLWICIKFRCTEIRTTTVLHLCQNWGIQWNSKRTRILNYVIEKDYWIQSLRIRKLLYLLLEILRAAVRGTSRKQIKSCSFRFNIRFYLNRDVSETGFCLRLQVELNLAQQIGLVYFSGPQADTCSIYWAQLKTETEFSLWNVVFWWIMSRIVIVILIYHRHKPIDSINLLGS